MTAYEVIVVGAGPAGAEAARAAARGGLRTLLVEEHPTVGVPSHCTGKLSHHAFADFEIPRTLAMNAVSAAVFHSPGGVSVRVRRASVDSYVVDRVAFDRWLAARAASAGAEVMTGVRITAARRNNGNTPLGAPNQTLGRLIHPDGTMGPVTKVGVDDWRHQ